MIVATLQLCNPEIPAAEWSGVQPGTPILISVNCYVQFNGISEDWQLMQISPKVGLCAGCRYVHVIQSARGSFFLMCKLAKTNPNFPKYPELPVIQCAGFQPPAPAEASE